MLYKLQRAGISQGDLVTVCGSVVRPVLEYARPVWHTNLQNYLSGNMKMIHEKNPKMHISCEKLCRYIQRLSLHTLKDRTVCMSDILNDLGLHWKKGRTVCVSDILNDLGLH